MPPLKVVRPQSPGASPKPLIFTKPHATPNFQLPNPILSPRLKHLCSVSFHLEPRTGSSQNFGPLSGVLLQRPNFVTMGTLLRRHTHVSPKGQKSLFVFMLCKLADAGDVQHRGNTTCPLSRPSVFVVPELRLYDKFHAFTNVRVCTPTESGALITNMAGYMFKLGSC